MINRDLGTITIAFNGADVRNEGSCWIVGETHCLSVPPRLRRVFSRASFDMGGRAYGPWQSLPARHRAMMLINGEPTLEPDFVALHPSIVYALRGFNLLATRMRQRNFPRTWKAGFNIALNAKSYSSARAAIARDLNLDMASATRLLRAITLKHRAVSDLFFSDAGVRLMRIDSDIALNTVMSCQIKGIPVLPVHDSFITPARHAGQTAEIMEACFASRFRQSDTAGSKSNPLQNHTLRRETPHERVGHQLTANSSRSNSELCTQNRKPSMQSKLKSSTLDQHFAETLRRVRAEFERSGEVHPGFECVTDAEIFHVPAHWPDPSAKGAACAALRDSFRRRGVNTYLFAGECWVGKTPGLRPADDPDRTESVQVLAVERNGLRRYAFAEIMRNGGTATLGPWQVSGDVPQSWLLELLEEGHSDRGVKVEPPPVGGISKSDFQDLVDQHPEQAAEFRDSIEIHAQLGDLIADQMQKGANGDAMAMFMALESVLCSIVKDMGSPKGLGQFARFLRDHPDKFPMFSTVPDQVPSTQYVRSCKATLQRFSCEKREAGHTLSQSLKLS